MTIRGFIKAITKAYFDLAGTKWLHSVLLYPAHLQSVTLVLIWLLAACTRWLLVGRVLFSSRGKEVVCWGMQRGLLDPAASLVCFTYSCGTHVHLPYFSSGACCFFLPWRVFPQSERVKITFGFNCKNKNHYGIMMYHKNRLIRSYEKVGCQKKVSG